MEHEIPRTGRYTTSGDHPHRQMGGQHKLLRGISVFPLEIFLMADQGRWFKLWVSAVSDPDLRNLNLEDFGRWVLFGAYLKLHGKNGIITLVPPALALQEMLRITTFDGVVNVLKSFPNCDVTHVTNSSVTILVKWKNWQKYQGDWSGDRTRRWRQKRDGQRDANVTAKEEKRREEKRREEKKNNPPSSPPGSSPKTEPNGGPPWGTSEALAALYNTSIPPGHPAVTKLSPARRQKALAYLRQFPDLSFWRQVMSEIGRSRFLTCGSKERPSFRGDFDWLLTKGKDGTENVVKVFEGRYRDQRPNEEEDD